MPALWGVVGVRDMPKVTAMMLTGLISYGSL